MVATFEISVPEHKEGSRECSAFDMQRGAGRVHVHCDSCEGVVMIEQEGPDASDYRVIDGERCPECNEPTCVSCMISDAQTGAKMCRACAESKVQDDREQFAIVESVQYAIGDLSGFMEREIERCNGLNILAGAESALDELIALAQKRKAQIDARRCALTMQTLVAA